MKKKENQYPSIADVKLDEIGIWSEIKIAILREYACAFTRILKTKAWCKGCCYIDAFAGAGMHLSRTTGEMVQGSPLNALFVEPRFDRIVLIDLDAEKVESLKTLCGHDKRIVAAYHEDPLYHSRDVIPVKIESSFPDPLYLLAIVNSWLMSWYHQKRNPKAQKGLFPKVLVGDLEKLPIRPIDSSNKSDLIEHDEIVKLAKKILAAKKDDPRIDTTTWEREIDERVYRLYGLTKEEIKIVEEAAGKGEK
jgi:hypothetical protein